MAENKTLGAKSGTEGMREVDLPWLFLYIQVWIGLEEQTFTESALESLVHIIISSNSVPSSMPITTLSLFVGSFNYPIATQQ